MTDEQGPDNVYDDAIATIEQLRESETPLILFYPSFEEDEDGNSKMSNTGLVSSFDIDATADIVAHIATGMAMQLMRGGTTFEDDNDAQT